MRHKIKITIRREPVARLLLRAIEDAVMDRVMREIEAGRIRSSRESCAAFDRYRDALAGDV